MLRLEEEDIYAGIATSGSGGGSLPFVFMEMLSTGDMTSDTSFDVEWVRELPNLSTETYTASFVFEETEEGSGEWRLTCGVSKDGEYLGETDVYANIAAYDGSVSTPIKLTTLTRDGENPYTFGFNAGGYECYFHVEIEDDTITFTGGNAYIGEDDYGSVDVYWAIKHNPPSPVQKGSFDSTTQQLTLNYDYLVEMINSSTATTAEQKSAMIALLNNQSPVINMATDIAVENSYIYGFMSTSGETLPVVLQVDKATPCTLKIMFDGESIGSLGSYQAIANYMTELSGETTTPEMVEAMFGSFIVDEQFCTISGTLGNFSVEFN